MTRTRAFAVLLVGTILFAGVGSATANTPGADWRQYATPEDAGWSSEKLAEAREYARKARSAAVMLVYRGDVVAAWGDVERKFKCHSVRKSLLSALYGPLVAAGKIDLNATLADLGIDDQPSLTEQERTARVVDLLSARSGIYHPAAYEPRDMKVNRPERGSHAPGTHWWYNNWDFNTSGTIYEKAAGRSLFEDFKTKIAGPIGMQDFEVGDTFYQLEPSSSIHKAYLFRLSTRDLARFGQLFLQNGSWNGREVVPAEWVKRSTGAHSTIEGRGGAMGYGYMWWVYDKGAFEPSSTTEHINQYAMYAGRGTGGQLVAVLPEAELVFVHRGDTDNRENGAATSTVRLLDMVLAARTGPAKEHPQFGPLSADPFPNAEPPPPARKAVPYDEASVTPYLGSFRSEQGMAIRTYLYEGRLYLLAEGEGEAEFFQGEDGWFFAKAGPIDIRFEDVADGKAARAVLRRQGRDVVLERE